MTAPLFSIVIPTHNCRATLARCLEAVGRLDYPAYEVIIVDDASTDFTPAIAASFAGVRVILMDDRGGPSRARNVGVREARGEVVAFTDGDCVADRNWLRELSRGFTDRRVAGVGGRQVSPPDDTEFGRSVQEFFQTIGFCTGYLQTGGDLRPTSHNPSCNAAYRREVLEELGGFDESLWPAEDVDLDRRLRDRGYTLMYNPGAVVAHYRPRSYGRLAAMLTRYGASQWPLFKRYGWFRKIFAVPLIMLGALALLTAGAAAGYALWPWLLGAILGCYLWFYQKTANFPKSARFLVFLGLTLACWHWGLVTGPWRTPAFRAGPK